MKKWFFSNDGKITGPFGLQAANEQVAKFPNAFAWHPSYAQWTPVSCIDDFDISITVPTPPAEVPKELYENFVGKERELISTLAGIDKTLTATTDSLAALDQDIDGSIEVAHHLYTEVKTTIDNIEQQFAALKKNIAVVKKHP
ncbi:MAG: GYF domain-containing protein [Thalassotalea sp.]